MVCRPPYQPQDGPVEFAINQVCLRLEKHWSEVSDLQTMRAVINISLIMILLIWKGHLCIVAIHGIDN